MPEPSIVERSVEKAHIWLDEVDESAQLAAQLPDLIRGIYYEGWNPSATPVKYHGFADFLDRVRSSARSTARTRSATGVRGFGGEVRPAAK